MLPASNRGVGMNMGMPDVCLTPAFPAPVPVPYPNIAMNAMAVPFAVKTLFTAMNALNMGSKIPMTTGDDAGVAHPFFKQMGQYTMGNPKIIVEGLPAVNLTSPTTGNMMNNPVGVAAVPSITTVFLALRPDGTRPTDSGAMCLSPEHAAGLGRSIARSDLQSTRLDCGVWLLRPAVFAADLPAQVHAALATAGEPPPPIVLDLRGNPGGESLACVELADDFLPEGALLLRLVETDGDETEFRARRSKVYPHPLVVLVDRRTASAAELFAGCLQAHRRAIVVGEPSYGKGSTRAVLPFLHDGNAVYATLGHCLLPDGTSLEGRGVEPDVLVAPTPSSAHDDAAHDDVAHDDAAHDDTAHDVALERAVTLALRLSPLGETP